MPELIIFHDMVKGMPLNKPGIRLASLLFIILFSLSSIIIIYNVRASSSVPSGFCTVSQTNPYMFTGSIRFFFLGSNGSLMPNGSVIFNASVKVSYARINSSFVRVYVSFSGIKYSGEIYTKYGNWVNVSGGFLKELKNVTKTRVNFTLTYIVNRASNYAWSEKTKSFIGFFPLYVFPDFTSSNLTKEKLVYMDEVLKPTEAVNLFVRGLGKITTFELSNDKLILQFVHNYPIVSISVMPVGVRDHTPVYMKLWLRTDQKWFSCVKAVDDYPKELVSVDYSFLVLFASLVAAGIAGIILAVQRLGRKKR